MSDYIIKRMGCDKRYRIVLDEGRCDDGYSAWQAGGTYIWKNQRN